MMSIKFYDRLGLPIWVGVNGPPIGNHALQVLWSCDPKSGDICWPI